MKKSPGLRGSSSLYREFYLAFGYTDGWWGSLLRGYSHVLLLEVLPDSSIVGIDFSTIGCPTFIMDRLPPSTLGMDSLIHLRVKLNRKGRMVRPIPLQTCATLAQTIMGVNLGATLVFDLYLRLTTQDPLWLADRGVTLLKD